MNVCVCNVCHIAINTAGEYARGEIMRARYGKLQVPLHEGPTHPRRFVHFHLTCYAAFCAATERVVPRQNTATDAELPTIFDGPHPLVLPGGDPPADEPIHPDHRAVDHPRAGQLSG